MNVYDFTVKAMDGTDISLSEFRGKVLLIVNTASQCGFTHQLEDLENLYQKYRQEGFMVVAFPCNQFGNQEPGTNEEIRTFCTTKYHVTFPVFAKIEVNGENADPLYQALTKAHPFGGFDLEHPLGPKLDQMLSEQDAEYALKRDIKWNFTKFLIDREGTCVKRFEPTTDIETIEEAIKTLV